MMIHDERDVIFIGTVYGQNPDGQFAQRFGPINGAAGKRRLNVLFTRAKEQIVTFTSIPMAKFNPSASNEGTRLLKLWLQYCHTKKLGEKTSQSDSGGIPDSPFEEHVLSVQEPWLQINADSCEEIAKQIQIASHRCR